MDNGISCKKEVEHAADLGIDVIVVDHHEPNDDLFPEIAIVVDPKVEDCGYPFPHISGCAVVYKLVTAFNGYTYVGQDGASDNNSQNCNGPSAQVVTAQQSILADSANWNNGTWSITANSVKFYDYIIG